MKKLIGCIVSLLAILCVGLGVTGCATPSDNSSGSDISEHVHSYTRLVVEPTCSKKGYTKYECSCGDSYTERETPINPNGHNYDESGICTLCGHENNTTLGIEYSVSEDGAYAEVVGYKGTETKVIIASTYSNLPVKSISKDAFNKSNIVEVIIPDSVTNIGDAAFSQCRELISVTIPDSVTSIGKGAFGDCCELTNVTLGKSVTSIGQRAFLYCHKLVEVYNKSAIDITAGSSDNGHVGYYAKNVYTPSSGQSKLSTESDYIVYTDGDDKILLGYNGDETNLVLPEGITEIYKQAFYIRDDLTSIIIPDSVTTIGDAAFYICTELTNVTLGKSVTSIEEHSFEACYRLVEIFNKSAIDITTGSSDNGCIGYYAKNVYSPTSGQSKLSTENDYVIYTDGENKALVSYVGNEKSLALPEGITEINQYAFRDFVELESVTIPDSVTTIGDAAFYYCSGLTSLLVPGGVTSIGEGAFYRCSGLTSITIPDGITTINPSTFYFCSGLTSITIPDSVTSIGGYAFQDCHSLTSIEIPESVTSIGNSTFAYCVGLTSIEIPDSVTNMGAAVFFHCLELTSVTIGNGVTDIMQSVFSDCGKLTSVTIRGNVTSIGGYAFQGCRSLTSIELPDSVTSIDYYAFHNCRSLTSIEIPDGVTSIDSYTFFYCNKLMSIIIPDSVTSIGESAFSGCGELENVYYKGTEEEWNAISVNPGNYSLTSATMYYYSETEPTTEGNFWHYDADGKVIEW